MSFKKLIMWGAVLALIATALATAPPATRAQSGNLLQNPGLNLPYTDGNKQANGWGRWFQEIPKPEHADALQYALNPNFSSETNPSGKFPQLILEGDASQHVGRQFDPWIGGLLQTVNVPPGSQVRFCAYSRLYAQNTDFGKGEPSVTAMNGRSQVGVFLNGATAWDNSGIVWSGTANPHDTWVNVCVTAGPVGDTGKVTVFTKNDWRDSGAIHLDAWWDQTELVTLGDQPTPQPTAPTQPQPQATTATQPQPQPQPQPVPGGGVVHTVVANDTLFGLSFQYDVPLDDIYALNGLNSQSILSIGQKIIIKAGTGTQVPAAQPTAAPAQPAAATAAPGEATPVATPPQPAEATPQAPATEPASPTQVAEASSTSVLCVFAFEDANADGLRQPEEIAVAGAKFNVVDGQGAQIAQYVSTDSPEPHCIKDLMPGSYSISVQPAPNMTATSDKRWGVPLTGGSTVNINFGSRSGEGSSAAASGNTADNTSSGKSSSGSNVGGIIAGIGGLVLLLAAGVIGAFVIARRRA
jgi:LysM repeat protein